MTPKEKALNLCQQFGNTTKFAKDCNDGYTLPLRVAKLCAIIAVNEILFLGASGDLKDPHHLYFRQVKTELENL